MSDSEPAARLMGKNISNNFLYTMFIKQQLSHSSNKLSSHFWTVPDDSAAIPEIYAYVGLVSESGWCSGSTFPRKTRGSELRPRPGENLSF